MATQCADACFLAPHAGLRCLACFCFRRGPSALIARKGRLPSAWRSLLEGGQLLSALLLSTTYSEKYRGRNMKPRETAALTLPAGDGASSTWRPTLLHRVGTLEAFAFIWLGDAALGDSTVYVAFSPLRNKQQFLKILKAGVASVVVEETFHRRRNDGAPAGMVERRGTRVNILDYVSELLRTLWENGFLERLSETLAAYPGRRVVFAGLSHGATLAQAAATRFFLECPKQSRAADLRVAAWNAYRWTDAAGSRLVGRVFRDRLLPLVLSRQTPDGQRRWDSVSGIPWGLAPLPRIALLDADTGDFLACHSVGETSLGVQAFSECFELHFARTALKGTREAMKTNFQGTPRLAGRSGASIVNSILSLEWEPISSRDNSREFRELEAVVGNVGEEAEDACLDEDRQEVTMLARQSLARIRENGTC